MSHKYDYDAVIIGAGIGGLVCGCYLAKAGMKTLIVEKNAKPGGYCTSFTRNGFHFDACVHSLGSLNKGEIIYDILKDLDIEKRIQFTRYDPSDIVITPDHKIHFYNAADRIIEEFAQHFPKEKENVKKFFRYIYSSEAFTHVELRKKTLKNLLDNYFSDYKLKSILSIFTLGNVGLPASLLSAFVGVKFYKQFMLDGGYYPKGGIQKFPDILALRFEELGGKLLASNIVRRINAPDSVAQGIILENGEEFISKHIISDCDVRQTFFDLIGTQKLGKEFINTITKLIPSVSMFILYLGIKEHSNQLPPEGVNVWFLQDYDLEKMYSLIEEAREDAPSWYMLRIHPDKQSLLVFVNSPFKNKGFWRDNKKRMINMLIKHLEQFIPNFSKYIVYKDAATPNTLYKWTLNYQGASYGWASLPSQFAVPGLSQITPIQNLYLTGHWATLAQGIPGVAHLGKDTAKIILQREKTKHNKNS